MRKIIPMFLLVFALVVCNTTDLKEKFVVGLSSTLTVALECNASQEVEKDIRHLFGASTKGVNLYSIEAEGFNPQLCKVITTGLIELALDRGVPKRWDCKMDKAHLILTSISDAVCERYSQSIAEY